MLSYPTVASTVLKTSAVGDTCTEFNQRCLKRKQQRSNTRAKLMQKIGKVHEQIAACRLDWQFKLAHHLCDRAGMIFVEDLDFRIMAKGLLGKHTLDAGLGQFVNQVLP